jgi:hypothetical protein
MKRVLLLALPALVSGLLVVGCGKDPVSPTTGSGANVESQAIEYEMAQTPDLADIDTYETPGESEFADELGSSAPFSTEAAIRPVFFFRVITERTRDIHIETEKDTSYEIARVRVEDRLAGTFNLVTRDSTDTGVVRRLIKKRLHDVGVMQARFRRRLGEDYGMMADRSRGWRLVAVSNREIASPEHTAKILSVRLEAQSGLDVTLTDPQLLMRFPEGLPKAVAGEPVKVTVQVQDPTDVVYMLVGWGRQRLHPVSEGVFAGSFRAPYQLRLFRVGVNALDRGTLFDDQAPYDSDFWGLLGRTAPPTLAAN